MSKKIMGVVLTLVILVGGLYLFLWLAPIDWSVGINAEEAKLTGNYEQMKSDLSGTLGIRATAASSVANLFFEQIGIEKYEGLENHGLKGNATIYADGVEFDCSIVGGELRAAYIGNVRVYSSTTASSSAVANIVDRTYSAYKVFVHSLARSFDVSDEVGADLYAALTMQGILSVTDVSSGKVDGVPGYFASEGMLRYFITLNESRTGISTIHVISSYFGNMEVYNAFHEAPFKLSDVKVVGGVRIGISNVMAYKLTKFTELGADGKTVKVPVALDTGDDAWLMIRRGDQIYLEIAGDVTDSEGKIKTYDFVAVIEGKDYNLIYAKMGRTELQIVS